MGTEKPLNALSDRMDLDRDRYDSYRRTCWPRIHKKHRRQIERLFPGGSDAPAFDVPANEGISEALAAVLGWSGGSFLITGATGSGKTLALAYCAMRALEGHGFDMPAPFYYFSTATLERDAVDLPKAATTGLLIVDDFHRAAVELAPWRRLQLFGVIDERYGEELPTIAASRRGSAELKETLGDEWVDRLTTDGGREIELDKDENWRRPNGG